jgi:ankyrin repeat protein
MDQQQQQQQEDSSSSVSSSPSASSSRKRQQHHCRSTSPHKYSRIEDEEQQQNHRHQHQHQHQNQDDDVAETIEDFIVNPRRFRPRPEWYTTKTKTINNDENENEITSFGSDLDSALLYCIRKSAIPAAWKLLETSTTACVNVENAKGVTPLIMAAQKGLTEICKALLERGANVQHVVTASGTTAVLQAAHFGHLEVLRVFLFEHHSRRSLLELANFNHTTPLMRASQEGHIHVVEYLVQRGALLNRKNRERMTALMLASQRGHSRICHYLVTYGADLDAMTSQQTTSVALATKRNHLSTVRVLLRAGCELYIEDSRGRTARDIALQRNNKTMADLLDPTIQIDLMRRYAREQRSWAILRMWTLLQKQRASVQGGDDHCYHHQHRHHSTNALMIRIMTLPAPLMQAIAQFAPLPDLWDKRIGLLTKRCAVNATAALESGLDLMDEVLEEGGFLQACDQAGISSPSSFETWVSKESIITPNNGFIYHSL